MVRWWQNFYFLIFFLFYFFYFLIIFELIRRIGYVCAYVLMYFFKVFETVDNWYKCIFGGILKFLYHTLLPQLVAYITSTRL